MAEPSEDLSVRPHIPEDKLVLYVKKGKIVQCCDGIQLLAFICRHSFCD